METQKLGNSGLKISKIILGCMSFGNKTWQKWVLDNEDEVMEIMKAAYDAGIRTFDTADAYSNGVSEKLVGKFLKKFNIPREKMVILTKCRFYVGEEGSGMLASLTADPIESLNQDGLSRKHILAAVDASVERLGTYIDVLQIHRIDKNTPSEETMEALHDVVKSGKVRYIGASSMRAYQFVRLQYVAESHGWTKFISMQNFYNLLYREEEREMIPFCKETGVGLIPWSPLARGILSRPLSKTKSTIRSETDGMDFSPQTESEKEIVNRVEKVAKDRGAPMAAIATAWVLAKGAVPIIGISSVKRVQEAVEAVGVKLTPEEISYLDEPYQARPVTGLFE